MNHLPPETPLDHAAYGLRFSALRLANVKRCEEVFHQLHDWSPTDWACAMAGECGEACNLIKKTRRGEAIDVDDIGDELADLVIYADLLAARLGLDLGRCIVKKFDEVSEKRNSKTFLCE